MFGFWLSQNSRGGLMKKDRRIHVAIEGAEGRIDAGLKNCDCCNVLLAGDVMVMLLAVDGKDPVPVKLFCSKKCYFIKFEEIDSGILADEGSEWVYEIGADERRKYRHGSR